ncbi:oxalate/formate antiporter [Kluyvera cryocrescens]|uniref:Oxalate/formate antiporter n=1 Tax=Kluyvera cryocrescens TaxID=580 RepID=A0A485AHY3_KLUCR|nr:oxalate/formate antiporter [Kluyvera cryocrescens]
MPPAPWRQGTEWGAILTTFPIAISLGSYGLEQTMTVFGLIFCRRRPAGKSGVKPAAEHGGDAGQAAKLRKALASSIRGRCCASRCSGLMFAMMAMMSTSGLMVTSQMAVFAEDFGISKAVVFGMAALPLALTIDRFTNGLTRPLFGFISDRYGREKTMFIAFALEGCAMTLWLGLPRRSAAVCAALRRGVFRLG